MRQHHCVLTFQSVWVGSVFQIVVDLLLKLEQSFSVPVAPFGGVDGDHKVVVVIDWFHLHLIQVFVALAANANRHHLCLLKLSPYIGQCFVTQSASTILGIEGRLPTVFASCCCWSWVQQRCSDVLPIEKLVTLSTGKSRFHEWGEKVN